MPSTTIQSRISAFESLATSSSPPSSKHVSSPTPSFSNAYARSASDILETPLSPMTAAPLQPVALLSRPSPSPSPPNLGRKTSLIDLKDWVVDDGPVVSNGFIDSSKTPTQQAFNGKGQSGPMSNHNTNGGPLISFESPPKPKPKPKPANLSVLFKAPPQLPPQLPPRKTSYTSLKSFTSSTSSAQSRHTDSLTVDHAHRYPPISLDPELLSRNASNHVPSSSVSSFHSVSLSEDNEPETPGSVTNYISTFPMDTVYRSPPANRRTADSDTTSLTESYEEVSTSSFSSPTTERLITLDWDRSMSQRRAIPPKLPERPNSRTPMKSTPPPSHPVSRTTSASGSSPNSPIIKPINSAMSPPSSYPTPYVPRRSAPPPPSSRSSDRSSIQSNATTHSQSSNSQQSHTSHTSRSIVHSPSLLSLKTKRPTPIPFGVRKRYEAVFNANVIQRRKAEKRKSEDKPALLSPGEARGRRAVGWRGLSVDLITGDEMVAQQNDTVNEMVGSDEKLEGAIVKLIWQRSGLDKERLAEIWNECDVTGKGAINVDGFVTGMWRIDEELRRAQAQAIKSATSNLGKYRANNVRAAPKLPQRPRDILR